MEEIAREIIEHAAKGDMVAFEAIYNTTSGFVYRTALRIVGNGADAQEATQDIFMKVYDNLKHFEFRSSFKTWVYRITVNTAINTYTKNAREHGRRGDYDTAIETAGYLPDAGRAVEKADAQKQLESLLQGLSPEHRAVIVLREIEGLRYEEIAASLHMQLNTVRSRLKRAREALMEQSKKAVQYAV